MKLGVAVVAPPGQLGKVLASLWSVQPVQLDHYGAHPATRQRVTPASHRTLTETQADPRVVERYYTRFIVQHESQRTTDPSWF